MFDAVGMGSYGMRMVQLDVEASLLHNPHLRMRERAAQEQYMATMLALLQEFLGSDRRTMTTTVYGLDESKFFTCTFVKGDDDLAWAFLAWLRSTPAMEERSRSLIVTKVHKDMGEVTREFALDAPVPVRLLRTMGSTKVQLETWGDGGKS